MRSTLPSFSSKLISRQHSRHAVCYEQDSAQCFLCVVYDFRICRPDLRVDLEPLSEAVSGSRCLRADLGAGYFHGRNGGRRENLRGIFGSMEKSIAGICRR